MLLLPLMFSLVLLPQAVLRSDAAGAVCVVSATWVK
jgi:hypothetical protein